jgi:hypothetical protein
VIRYRAKVVQSRTSQVQRLGNVLQDAGIKIDSVASPVTTKSGRAMIEALTDGERRPEVLAELAPGRMRPKIPDLAMALEGRFGEHHALMCRLHLDHIDHLEAMIAKLDAQIEAMMAPDDSRQTAVHRRTTEPWYRTKTAPAFEDMLTTLRRTLITVRISAGSQAHLTPEQTQAVLAAWHAAAA